MPRTEDEVPEKAEPLGQVGPLLVYQRVASPQVLIINGKVSTVSVNQELTKRRTGSPHPSEDFFQVLIAYLVSNGPAPRAIHHYPLLQSIKATVTSHLQDYSGGHTLKGRGGGGFRARPCRAGPRCRGAVLANQLNSSVTSGRSYSATGAEACRHAAPRHRRRRRRRACRRGTCSPPSQRRRQRASAEKCPPSYVKLAEILCKP